MRMWMVNPKILCTKHLGGEHVECHMFVGTLLLGKSIAGYLEKGLVEVHNLRSRHHKLAQELLRRGGNHKSPLPKFSAKRRGKINKAQSLKELLRRCKKCRSRYRTLKMKGKV